MERELNLLVKRGFCVISIMVDPDGEATETHADCYLSLVYKDIKSEIRFIKKVTNVDHIKHSLSEMIKMHDDKAGKVWRISNKRIALNTLPPHNWYIQCTENGASIARELLGLAIDERPVRPVKKPSQQGTD